MQTLLLSAVFNTPAERLPGIDGFLGTRASLMIDVVSVAMVLVLAALAFSILTVRYRQNYTLHKRIQLMLGTVLLVAVAAFEIDIQFISRWRVRAAASAYYSDVWQQSTVDWALDVHLVFAVSTALLWIFVIVQALRKIPRPPAPCPYSRTHMFWARLAAIDMCLTTLTGWIFYVLAFVL